MNIAYSRDITIILDTSISKHKKQIPLLENNIIYNIIKKQYETKCGYLHLYKSKFYQFYIKKWFYTHWYVTSMSGCENQF